MKKYWSAAEEQYLELHYPNSSTKDIAVRLNRTIQSVYDQVSKMGLKKTDEFMKITRRIDLHEKGSAYRFQKGLVPWNKGLKYPAVSIETCFKKGNKPPNTQYDGAISVRWDGDKAYKFIRISEKKWVPLHVKIWTDINGPVPDGYLVVFKNNKEENRERIDNLELITRAENMERNSYHRYPADLKFAMKRLKQLKQLIQHEEQNNE